MIEKYDAATEPGAKGALLRGEGLYDSHISYWRKARDSGALTIFKGGGYSSGDGLRPRVANRHAVGVAAGGFHRLASGGIWPVVQAAARSRPSAYVDAKTDVSIC